MHSFCLYLVTVLLLLLLFLFSDHRLRPRMANTGVLNVVTVLS